MADRNFVDTSVFLYAVDGSEPAKQRRAKEILRSTQGITVSTQVLTEYYVVATRKLKPSVPEGIASATMEPMARYHCVPMPARRQRAGGGGVRTGCGRGGGGSGRAVPCRRAYGRW